MQDQRKRDPLHELPDPYSPEYEAQKLLLLELVVDPPPEGDQIGTLCLLLELSREEVDAATARLSVVGLAERREDRVFASEAARYFEHLWPTGL